MAIKLNGFDDLQKQLKKMEKAAKELDGEHKVGFDVLFNESFMKKYTKYNDFDTFLIAGDFQVETNEDFEAIPESILNEHVKLSTNFSSWENMLNSATQKYISKKLGF